MLFEVVKFVQTTRRWYDRGNPRDAGELDACQRANRGRVTERWPSSRINNRTPRNYRDISAVPFLLPKIRRGVVVKERRCMGGDPVKSVAEKKARMTKPFRGGAGICHLFFSLSHARIRYIAIKE